MRRRQHHEEHENAERWLLTYADLITLLLAFFIVMYSMSQVDAKKFGAVTTALKRILSGGGLLLKADQGTVIAPREAYVPAESQDLRVVMDDMSLELSRKHLDRKVRLTQDARGVVLSMAEKVLFESGRADLNPGARTLLDTVSTLLVRFPNEIRVEGHTDNVPVHNGRFDSNWELSAARATSVVRYLAEGGLLPPFQLSAAGYGEFRPASPNDTPAHQALNRRVDFVILSPVPEAPARATEVQGGKRAR